MSPGTRMLSGRHQLSPLQAVVPLANFLRFRSPASHLHNEENCPIRFRGAVVRINEIIHQKLRSVANTE